MLEPSRFGRGNEDSRGAGIQLVTPKIRRSARIREREESLYAWRLGFQEVQGEKPVNKSGSLECSVLGACRQPGSPAVFHVIAK
ncbi:hypothetical protein S7711_10806 [Stachybotrys chartarum IBT 7711]|uniref:Uncharacterized protein n=1 Tax=Stachybotrys chartarum (strain CBS 109288 / IBT 7711) TaxID=1280523 RepID=A0A084AR56_STACB|nr:hypothetical protein S7711_10806 [Stachybotrys chartarum IBT 7711]KFA45584.1 hypothetical protein S40293_11088 [Stachybotrys chartarum IBT 40293]KFA71590.1 hypothetical protein S40288_11372 [Stachybotrys chartarum IBT 40288]